METNTVQLIDAALHLPHYARAFLAERLLESLDAGPDFQLSEEWTEEIVRRCQEIDRGEVELLEGDLVFEQAFKALM